MLAGVEGFTQVPEKTALKTLSKPLLTKKKKYNVYYDKFGLINGKKNLWTQKDMIKLRLIIYLSDFYAIERFGKTRLGTHYAKQGQNKPLMKILGKQLKPKLENVFCSFIWCGSLCTSTIKKRSANNEIYGNPS